MGIVIFGFAIFGIIFLIRFKKIKKRERKEMSIEMANQQTELMRQMCEAYGLPSDMAPSVAASPKKRGVVFDSVLGFSFAAYLVLIVLPFILSSVF